MTRIETAGLLALTLALAAGMVLPAGAVSGPATLQQTDGEQPSVENVSAAVGQQLSTVLSTTTTEVRSEADEAGFEKRFNESNSTERGAAIADRADELESRAAELRADYEATTEAYRNGEIDASMFAQRIASLTATANTVEGSTDSLADRAAEIPDAERRALGITDSEFDVIYDEIDPVSGRTAGAILSQFTAQDRGEIAIEIDGGISIEVTSEEDGQSRQFERPRDGDGSYELNQSEALDIATDALSAPNGEWVLTSVETDDGAYEFEFALDGPGEGEAEVSVDGATGTVFELEESMEAEDDDDDDDDESEFERLVITVTEGEPAPGENVTLTVTGAGEPVENATVELNDGTVGQTDANGTITVTIPSEEAEFEVTAGEAEGELSFEFEEDEDREEELGATADIENGTVTVSVVSNGEPVEGATVTANGASVGTTGANGTVSFDLPAGDELEIEIQDGDREAELEYELEEGEDDSDEDENERDEDDEEDDDEQEDEEQDDGDGEAGDSDDSSDDEDSETETEEVADGTDEESDDEQADGEDEVDDGDDEQADEEDEAEEDDDTDADDEDDEDDE